MVQGRSALNVDQNWIWLQRLALYFPKVWECLDLGTYFGQACSLICPDERQPINVKSKFFCLGYTSVTKLMPMGSHVVTGWKIWPRVFIVSSNKEKKPIEEKKHKTLNGQAAGLLLTSLAKLMIYSNINISCNQAKFTV